MDISSFSFPLLLIIFAASGVAIWIAGVQVSKTTDALSKRFNLGEALGGVILLAIVTNLPEIAIVISSATANNVGIAVGNILGGIAIQTVVIAVLDIFGAGKKFSLTSSVNSLIPVLEGILVIAILAVTIMGHELPSSLILLRISPADLLILIFWITGIYFVSKAKSGLPWIAKPGVSQMEPRNTKNLSDKGNKKVENQEKNTKRNIVIFLTCAIVTLAAGVALTLSSDAISKRIGMQGVIFGATILATVTSLPEVATGLAAIKLQDNEMALSDILGGNAFLPVLFLAATFISGKPVLPMEKKTDVYLTALAMLLTTIYVYGFTFRSKKQIFRMGIDSFIVVILYLVGIIGLFAIR